MSRDRDPDRSLEHLLRQSRSDPPPAAGPDCLDAEQLAAWSAGALPASERSDIERHLSDCARCQALLSAFVRSDDAPAASSWRGLRARWLVPITVGAAATIIWMTRPVPTPTTLAPMDTMARVEQAPAPASPSGATEPAAPPPAESALLQQKGLGADDVQGQEVREAEARLRDSVTASPRPAAPQAMADRIEKPAVASEEPALLMRAAPAVVEIVAPDPRYRWRIRGTLVERSTTDGASWAPTERPSGTVVTAGASPAPLVCWLIGPSGTVLRTTDGSRFESRDIAGAGALSAIRADDADRAAVTAADGRVFTTADGGRTWR